MQLLGSNKILHARSPQSPGTEVEGWEGSKRGAFSGSEDREREGGRDGRDSDFTEKRTSCLGKDRRWWRQDRPGGDLPFVVSRSHLCARRLCSRRRASARARGASSPPGPSRRAVRPHTVLLQGPLAPTGPPPSPGGVADGERTQASPRADNPPRTPRVGLCPAGGRGLLGSPRQSPSWRPGGPRGRPSFVRSAGSGEADTYRTPQRGKARATPTPAAETLLCSSDGPYPRQMEGARRWRRRRRRSWGQTPPPPPSPWLLPARSAAAEGGRGRPRALPTASPRRAGFPGRWVKREGHRDARRGRAGRRMRGSGLVGAPPPPDGELEPPAPALIRALGNPLARLPWCPPRAPLDSAELAPLARAPGARAARQCQSMCERRELRSLESRAPESRCGGGGFVR